VLKGTKPQERRLDLKRSGARPGDTSSSALAAGSGPVVPVRQTAKSNWVVALLVD
jgi:hypothetical protein